MYESSDDLKWYLANQEYDETISLVDEDQSEKSMELDDKYKELRERLRLEEIENNKQKCLGKKKYKRDAAIYNSLNYIKNKLKMDVDIDNVKTFHCHYCDHYHIRDRSKM